MFRGSAPAKIDDKGRLKIPTGFRRQLDERYASDELFITSLTGDAALVYPLSVWEEMEARLLALPSTHPSRNRFLARVNYYGQQVRLDGQGRALVPQILREVADIQGEVVVVGELDHLVVRNHEKYAGQLAGDPFTDEDARTLSELGI